MTDVYADEGGEVWHAVDGVLKPGAQVEGQIDWPRRFDHMQQHAGEHMLAGAIYRRLGGHTIGLHLGAEISTIDVELPGGAMRAAGDVLDEIEDAVNRDIQRDLPILGAGFPRRSNWRRCSPSQAAGRSREHPRGAGRG